MDGLNAFLVLSRADLTNEDEGRFESEITSEYEGQNGLEKPYPIYNSVLTQGKCYG